MSWFHIMLEGKEMPKSKKTNKNGNGNGGRRKNGNDDDAFISFRDRFRATIFRELLDILYFGLSAFTYFYIITVAVLFFGQLWHEYYVLSFFMAALSEPYLGAVAVYTILKEYRKKTRRFGSLHRGEIFVGAWTAMFFGAVGITALSPEFTLGEPLEIIITNGVAVMFIYLGGVAHKP